MRDPSTRDASLLVVAIGVLVTAGVVLLPAGVLPSSAFAALPIVAASVLRRRGAATTAVAAAGAAALVGGLNEGFDRHLLERITIVVVVGAVAVLLAGLRSRVDSEASRASSAERLSILARRLGEATSVRHVLEVVIVEGSRVLGATRIAARVTVRSDTLVVAATPAGQTLVDDGSDPAPGGPDEVLATALTEGEELDATLVRRLDSHGDGDEQLVLVPLRGSDDARGSIACVTPHPPDADLLDGVAEQVVLALDRALLLDRRLRDSELLQTLQRATATLNDAMTVPQVASAMVDAGIYGMGADRVVVAELVDRDQLHVVAQQGVDDGRLEAWSTFPLELSTPLGDAVRLRHRLVAETPEELTRRWSSAYGSEPVGSAAMIAVPLIVRNQVVGGAYIGFRRPRRFDDQELAMVSILAGRCAGALVRSRLYERERSIATALQAQLLPVLPDLPPWLRASARYFPATGVDVGGDWYQLFPVSEQRVAALVGDVVGHGISAAAAMGQFRAVAASAVRSDPDPVAVFRVLDDFATEQPETMFATAALVSLDAEQRTLTYCRAGHPPPVHVSQGTSSALLDGGGPPLGLRPISDRATVTVPLARGDHVVLYSDGLVERRFMDTSERFAKLLKSASAASVMDIDGFADHLIGDMLAEQTTEDDVAMLALQTLF